MECQRQSRAAPRQKAGRHCSLTLVVTFFGICIGVDNKEEIRFVSTGLSFFVPVFKQEEKE